MGNKMEQSFQMEGCQMVQTRPVSIFCGKLPFIFAHLAIKFSSVFPREWTRPLIWLCSRYFSRAFHGSRSHVSRGWAFFHALATLRSLLRRLFVTGNMQLGRESIVFRNTSTWQLILTIYKVKLGLLHRSDDLATDVRYFYNALSSVV